MITSILHQYIDRHKRQMDTELQMFGFTYYIKSYPLFTQIELDKGALKFYVTFILYLLYIRIQCPKVRYSAMCELY